MTQFANSFTGKGIAPVLPSGEGLQHSQERMGDMLIAAEKTKYDIFQKNAEEFRKDVNIDPVALLSDSAMRVQSKYISDFNNKWGAIKHQNRDHLSEDQQVQMQSEKNVVIMHQQKMQSDMQQAMQEKEIVDKDAGRTFDGTEWYQKKWKPYIESGNWNSSPIPIKSKSIDEFLLKNPLSNKITIEETPEEKGGYKGLASTKYSTDEVSAREHVKNVILSNDAYGKDAIQQFLDQPEAIKKQYFVDKNKDGVISADEATDINPIIKWAQDTKWQKARRVEDRAWRKLETSTGNSGNMRTWQKQVYTPTSAMDSPYPGLPSKSYHPFPQLVKQMTIPIARMELLEPDKVTPSIERPQQSIKGFVTGYDEESDKITFLISQDYKDLDYPTLASGKGMQIAVPRSAFSKEIFDDIEIVKDGKMIKLKDITTAQKTTTTPVKKRFNSVTGKFE
jgi:hypothetical protein